MGCIKIGVPLPNLFSASARVASIATRASLKRRSGWSPNPARGTVCLGASTPAGNRPIPNTYMLRSRCWKLGLARSGRPASRARSKPLVVAVSVSVRCSRTCREFHLPSGACASASADALPAASSVWRRTISSSGDTYLIPLSGAARGCQVSTNNKNSCAGSQAHRSGNLQSVGRLELSCKGCSAAFAIFLLEAANRL